MNWKVELDPGVEKELSKLDPQHTRRILNFLFDKLTHLSNPRSIGEALKGKRFNTLWKYRLGNYRIISSIHDNELQILVLKIGNRKDVYR